ncbi:hypothetical protein DID88_009597 [Monilinia fructigena]|uniref:Uncharacterized protein n=1 Tax=Monilinia fructigena TaxID=38457 RepID=A0A395IPQ7_9HELO|nr:hypothetical protein DID88_009597 [Monilinia fructigena]
MAPIIPDEAQFTTTSTLAYASYYCAPLDHYLSEDHQRGPFDARLFVRGVHIALTRRNELARSFLQSSSQSRLVFLNGGSVSARAICVAKISQRLTCGNLAEAETIFHDVVKDGVAGLFENTKSSQSTILSGLATETIGPRTKLPKRLDLRSTKSAPTLDGKDQPEQESSTVEENKISGAQKSRIGDDSGLQIITNPWRISDNHARTTDVGIPARRRYCDNGSVNTPSTWDTSVNDLGDPFKVSRRDFIRDSTFERLPKTAFVRASETTIRGSSSPSTPTLGNSIRSRGVHRTLERCGTEVKDSTKPVFDIAEDMIIHFTDNSPREIVRSISEYRSGNFPISPSISPQSLPTPPDTASLADECFDQGKPTTRRDYQQRAEIDRLCSSNSAALEEMKQQRASENAGAATNGFLQTPKSAMLALYSHPTEKFCEFSGACTNKPIDIQNEFRSFLSSRFIEEATVLSHYQNSLMPECGEFWRDMFLIASAMQTFMSQPLLARKDLDPMTDPRLLAELIVPHLEQYLITNSLVRFLVLSFPFNQISTVIALRSLLGSDLVKVAGVLDTLSSDPPSFVKPPLPQFHASNHSCDAVLATSRRSERPQRYALKPSLDIFKITNAQSILNRPSVSSSLFFKADYHLPSTASPSEIQNFVNLIRKNIVERSSWYTIEQVAVQPSPIPSQVVLINDTSTSINESLRMDSNTDMPHLMVEQDSRRPLSYLYDSEASENETLPSPTRLFPFPNKSCINSRPISPPSALVSSSCSLSDSIIRHTPIAIERQPIPQDLTSSSDELFPQDQEQKQDQDSENIYEHCISSSTPAFLDRAHSNIPPGSVDLDLELEAAEDSEDDEYDRMVMGRYSPMGARQRSMVFQKKFEAGDQDLDTRPMKGNSRKALKWLGLA